MSSGFIVIGNRTYRVCNYTVGESHLFKIVNIQGELSLLRQLSVLGVKMILPNATSIGYRQLWVSIQPCVTVNGVIKCFNCLVKLYGVPSNVWLGSTPLAYGNWLSLMILNYDALTQLRQLT